MKIDFPIYLGHFPSNLPIQGNVKIDFRVFEFLGGDNFGKQLQYNLKPLLFDISFQYAVYPALILDGFPKGPDRMVFPSMLVKVP